MNLDSKELREMFRGKILILLQKAGKKPVLPKELQSKCGVRPREIAVYCEVLDDLIKQGFVSSSKRGFVLSKANGVFPAVVMRINRTFGFIKRTDNETEIFVPGKFLMGTLPGDKVQARLIPSRTDKPEAEIVKVLEEADARFTGVIGSDNGHRVIIPDTLVKSPLTLIGSESFQIGEKILAEVVSRGKRHSDHVAKVVTVFGSADKASSCAKSILELNGVSLDFPQAVVDEAENMEGEITEKEIIGRTDLRSEVIFTIDGADTKDIDDAISVKKYSDFYELGVHIADVSHYVKLGSALDKEAYERGTSIYYADRVVPMLPKELSNGICSLNPNEDRLAFSCIMTIGFDGKLQDFDFKKSVICSRVKGVYSEINQILAGTESDEIKKKYDGLYKEIALMKELANILTARKIARGAPQLETSESKLIIDENDICVDVKPYERGESQLFIEEFMLMANQCAAKLGRKLDIPFVYRVHEDPSAEKVENLKSTMAKMGIDTPDYEEIKPSDLAKLVEDARGKDTFAVVNKLVLRSMAKAKYSIDHLGHFGLVLKDYAHFTSPIRRYPDLSIHRIMTAVIEGMSTENVRKKYTAFASASANQSTQAELTAMQVERECEDCYKAEYMAAHIGDEYEGIVSGAQEYGIYVELPNTVEGLVHTDNLGHGLYDYDGAVSLRNVVSGKSFTVGDRIKVRCIKASVSSGDVDFELIDD